jgi:hypothetical protein
MVYEENEVGVGRTQTRFPLNSITFVGGQRRKVQEEIYYRILVGSRLQGCCFTVLFYIFGTWMVHLFFPQSSD